MRYSLADLSIDPLTRSVKRGRLAIKLPDLSFELLLALLEAAPEALGQERLSKLVWKSSHVSDETLAQRIALLRKALNDDAQDPTYIRTVRGQGYAIAGEVSVLSDRPDLPTDQTPRRLALPVVAILGLAAAVGLASVWSGGGESAGIVHSENSVSGDENRLLIERARQQLALHQSAETDRAVEMLRSAVARAPDSFEARLMLSFALSTKATKFGGTRGHKREAEALARALIAEKEDSSDAWSALGYSLGSMGRIDESLSAYLRAFQLDPSNASAGSSAAYSYLLQGKLYQALQLELQVRDAGGHSRYGELQIAHSLELIGHPDTARWYDKARRLNPDQVVVLAELARSRLRHGKPLEALDILARAKDSDARVPMILQLKGRANLVLGRTDDARRLYAAAGSYARYELAALNASYGDHAKAGLLLSADGLAGLDADPDPQFRIVLAELAAATGEFDQATSFVAQAISLGWRDEDWLLKSPFLGPVMQTDTGFDLSARIRREIDLQRKLTEGDPNLVRAIRS